MLFALRVGAFAVLCLVGYLWAFAGHHWMIWLWIAALFAVNALNIYAYWSKRPPGAAADGRIMKWWTRAPGPSKNPDDYR
jgi:hypothetical protein